MKDRALGKTAKIRRERLYTAGLTIRTTVDLDYQAAADTAVASARQPDRQRHGRAGDGRARHR